MRKFLFEHRFSRFDAVAICAASVLVANEFVWLGIGVIVLTAFVDVIFAHGDNFDDLD